MSPSLLRTFVILCSLFTVTANARSFPKKMKVKGACANYQGIENLKVKLLSANKAIISGSVSIEGIQISVMDKNIPTGFSGASFINEDGSFEITTWLRSQNNVEKYNLYVSNTQNSSTLICDFTFKSKRIKKDKKKTFQAELLPSSQVQSDNEVIIDLVNQITDGETNDKQKFILIQEWMHRNISFDYDRVFKMKDDTSHSIKNDTDEWVTPSAIRTLERNKGICSEIAMLSVALMRAANIPTRAVRGTFHGGGHQWADAYIDNAWLEYEPALPSNAVRDWEMYERTNVDARL